MRWLLPTKAGKSGRELAQTFRAIFEQSPIGIIIYDARGLILKVNPAVMAIFGIAREEDVRDIPLFQEPNLPPGVAERMLAGESVRLTAPYDFATVREQGFYPRAARARFSSRRSSRRSGPGAAPPDSCCRSRT